MKNTLQEPTGQAIGREARKPFSVPRSQVSPSATVASGIVLGMLVMMIIPAILALGSVRIPAILQVQPDASPHGYTWSLLLFIIPILVITVWFLRMEELEISQRAYWRTIGILVPTGCLLDAICAQ
jgi:hypothetical protein